MSGLSRASLSNLRQGAVYMLVGLVWGMVVPAAPYPRLALTAHVQLTANGVMFLVAGLVIAHLPTAARGVGTNPHRRALADLARHVDRDGQRVVGSQEHAAHRRRAGRCGRCPAVARERRYTRPHHRCLGLGRVLGGTRGRIIPANGRTR
jgi:hypothetical protein